MKKQCVLFLAIALISINAYSQESKIKYSFQGGVNYSRFRGSDFLNVGKDKFSLAYLFGASFEYKIKEKLALKVDVNYERKVQKTNNTLSYIFDPNDPIITAPDFVITGFSNYIAVPILIKYNFSNDKSFYLNGGPFLGFLLNSGIKTDLDIEGLDTSPANTTKSNKILDLGIAFGIGKEFKISDKNKIYIELRDNLGLVNTNKERSPYFNNEIMTNSINLIVGYSLN